MSGNWWDALNKSKLLRKMGMVMGQQIKGNLRLTVSYPTNTVQI